MKLGNEIYLNLLAPAKDQSIKSDKTIGVYEGIHFRYTCNTTRRSNSVFLRIIMRLLGIIRSIVFIHKIKKKKNSSLLILLLITKQFDLILFIIYSKLYGIKIYHERTELPSVVLPNSLISKISLLIYYKWVIPKFDGIFVITQYLVNHFSKYVSSKNSLKMIPMLVEPERFQCSYSEESNLEYIAYCGTMYGDKDGVPILLEAFDIFAEKISDIQLYLIGDTTDANRLSFVLQKLSSMRYKERVKLLGFIGRDDLPKLLCRASLLVLARPNNLQAKGGFPTKLGEYLATGNPVVVTKVGEIPNYLHDQQNAFLAEPGNALSFALKMIEALKDRKKSKLVGLNGKNLTYTSFNYMVQSKELDNFLRT